MSKHSPGPWYIDGFDVKVNKPEREFLGDGAPETICEMLSSVCPEETTANQRLIAAAPELLSVLREQTRLIEQFLTGELAAFPSAIRGQAKEAIAKAA